jgi:hypothetical protein
MTRVLTKEAQAERADFQSEHGTDGNCSCHLSPPCESCMHPGNPLNQDEDESCWVESTSSVNATLTIGGLSLHGTVTITLPAAARNGVAFTIRNEGDSSLQIKSPVRITATAKEFKLTAKGKHWITSLKPKAERVKKAQWKRERSKFSR